MAEHGSLTHTQDAKWLNMGVLHISRGRNFCFFVCWNKHYGCYTENISGLIRNSCTKHCDLFVGATLGRKASLKVCSFR
jgi:hypothetical protein